MSSNGYPPRMTAAEERQLAEKVAEGRRAEMCLRQNADLSPAQREELCRQQQVGWEARECLILANQALVKWVAGKFVGLGLPFPDLVQEGNIGLMRVLENNNPQRGHRLNTYAIPYIHGAIYSALQNQVRTIRVPRNELQQANKVASLVHKTDTPPTAAELGRLAGMPASRAAHLLTVHEQHTVSLDGEGLADFIADTETPPVEQGVEQALMTKTLNAMLDRLPPRQSRIVRLYFGLDGSGVGAVMAEVAQQVGETTSNANHLLRSAMRQLRNMPAAGELRLLWQE